MKKNIYKYIINPFIKKYPEECENIQLYDAEFDMENIEVISVERDNNITIIEYYDKYTKLLEQSTIPTTLDCHNDFVKRLSAKINKNEIN